MSVAIQIRDVPEGVRDALAEMARRRGQSMQAYLLALLEQEAGFARNLAILQQIEDDANGAVLDRDDVLAGIDQDRDERDIRNSGGTD